MVARSRDAKFPAVPVATSQAQLLGEGQYASQAVGIASGRLFLGSSVDPISEPWAPAVENRQLPAKAKGGANGPAFLKQIQTTHPYSEARVPRFPS